MRKYLLITFLSVLFLPSFAFAAAGQRWISQNGYYAANLNYVFTVKRKITRLKPPVIKVAPYRAATLNAGVSIVSALNLLKKSIAAEKGKKIKFLQKTGSYTVSGFHFNSSKINRYMTPQMNDIKYMLKNGRIKIISITGYTDRIGSRAYNARLALKRAKSAELYFRIKVNIKGLGKCCYVSRKSKLNRRVKIIFKKDKR